MRAMNAGSTYIAFELQVAHWGLIKRLRNAMGLEQELRDYTNLSHANAWRVNTAVGTGVRPDEPAFVSSLLSFELFRGMRRILRKYASPSTNVMTRGIFTHQTPKVKLATHTHSVEIADLMFVHQHFHADPRHPVDGRAILLQAKNTLKPKTGSLASGTQAIQFELYRDWAAFKGTSRLPEYAPGGGLWNFSLGGPAGRPSASAGSAYFTVFKEEAYQTTLAVPQWSSVTALGLSHPKLLKNKYPLECTWAVGDSPLAGAPPKNGVDCPRDFGTALSDFLLGKIGRAFTPGLSAGLDHWSIFVNLMLAESARGSGDYRYNLANQGISAAARGRNLSFVALELALKHSRIAETDDFMDSLVDSGEFPGFEFTNHILNSMRVLGEESYDGGNFFPGDAPGLILQGGHVPVLYVATSGDNTQAFRCFVG